MTAAIIVAAGSSTRMGFDKLLASLAGEPVIVHALRAFQNCEDIDGIWVVSNAERGPVIQKLAACLTKFRGMVPGGAARHLSVWNGIQALPAECKVVAIHDGARPLIAPAQISKCMKHARGAPQASARRITETVKRVDEDGCIIGDVERDGLWIMETPQVCELAWLREAYQHVINKGLTVTDEVSALMHSGFPVYAVENTTPNPKITLPGDIEFAERLWASSSSANSPVRPPLPGCHHAESPPQGDSSECRGNP